VNGYRIVVLDAGPTGIASNDPVRKSAARCLAWLSALDTAGTEIVIPAIADYEVRRELIRVGATDGEARLDALRSWLTFLPLSDTASPRSSGRSSATWAGRRPMPTHWTATRSSPRRPRSAGRRVTTS
jgi:hypothetical protein